MALTPLYGKNSGVNAVLPEKQRRQRRLTGTIAALMPFYWKNSGVDAVVPEKERLQRR